MTIADVSDRSLAELISLAGRTAVVTGGARGLGEAIGARFAEAGASVILGDIDAAAAEATAKGLRERFDVQAIGIELDVRETGSIEAAADRAVSDCGGLDIWVNNAAARSRSHVLEMSDEQWDAMISVALRGSFIGSREAGKRMVAGGKGGVIINVSSTAAFHSARGGTVHYVSSKSGITGLTRHMAMELAPDNIRVLAVAPTFTMTPGVEAIMASTGATFDIESDSLLGRAGVPDDVARVALFAASDMAVFMTGSTLIVDAGRLTK